MAEAEGALTAPWEDESKDSTGYSDPIKNTLAGGFGGICLVAAGKFWSSNKIALGSPERYFFLTFLATDDPYINLQQVSL